MSICPLRARAGGGPLLRLLSLDLRAQQLVCVCGPCVDTATRRVPARRQEDWQDDMSWMVMYFVFNPLDSIALTTAPTIKATRTAMLSTAMLSTARALAPLLTPQIKGQGFSEKQPKATARRRRRTVQYYGRRARCLRRDTRDETKVLAFDPMIHAHGTSYPTTIAHHRRDLANMSRSSRRQPLLVLTSMRSLLLLALLPSVSTCSASDVDTCQYPRDGECDNPQYCTGTCADFYDCQVARPNDITCADCLAGRGAWCAAAATCFSEVQSADSLTYGDGLLCPDASAWETATCPNTTTQVYDDPMYETQSWVYGLVNVAPAWRMGYTGAGVQIVFNDDGLDLTSPDLRTLPDGTNKFDEDGSCLGGQVNLADSTHGTATASIALGNANSFCSVGIAPNARVAGCPSLASSAASAGFTSAAPSTDRMLAFGIDRNDISSNSWGLDPCSSRTEPFSPCGESCNYSADGDCDDGGPGAEYTEYCQLGTDCADCGPRTIIPCLETCEYSADTECDDGGLGAEYDVCSLGTDCADCGSRGDGPPSPPRPPMVAPPPAYPRQATSACPFSSEITVDQYLSSAASAAPYQVASPCFASVCPADWRHAPSAVCEGIIRDYCRAQANFHETGLDPACGHFWHLSMQCGYTDLSEARVRTLQYATTNGRAGKGTIFVFSSGNEHDVGEDVNFEGELFTRYTIAVGAVGKLGRHSSYSTAGVALLVSAPGGDGEFSNNHVVAQPGGACADVGIGTSYSAPVVSGVVALMLEANPQLTWRDVQGVIATTASFTDPADASWVATASGLRHSVKYGFGIVDAHAAVLAAQSWSLYSAERRLTASSTAAASVPQDGSTLALTLATSPASPFQIEHVYVYLDLEHSARGDLQLVLVSPAGTESVLIPGPRPEAEPSAATRNTPQCSAETDTCTWQDDGACDFGFGCGCDFNDCGGDAMPYDYGPSTWNWKMATVRLWNEDPSGTWTLRITDRRLANTHAVAVVNSWSVFVYGHDARPLPRRSMSQLGFTLEVAGDVSSFTPSVLSEIEAVLAAEVGVHPSAVRVSASSGSVILDVAMELPTATASAVQAAMATATASPSSATAMLARVSGVSIQVLATTTPTVTDVSPSGSAEASHSEIAVVIGAGTIVGVGLIAGGLYLARKRSKVAPRA